MLNAHETEIRQNFDFFQGVVTGLMQSHAGEYALLHDQTVVDIFPRPGDALRAGCQRFAEGPFSIQKITDRPMDLGFLSYGSGERAAD